MKTIMTKTLMTVSFLTLMAVSVPAMADTGVLCAVRENFKGAAYQPGVDVKGKPVVAADVAPPAMTVPKSMTIPLTVELAQRFNDVLPIDSKLEAKVGLVEVKDDGHVIVNGKDLTAPADTMCSTIAKQKEAALKTKDAPKKVAPKKKKVVAPVEPAPAEAPVVEAAPAAPVAAPEPAPAAPQVLDAAPPAIPAPPAPEAAAPQPVPVAPQTLTAPPALDAAPTPPPSGAIVSPTEGARPPMDPLATAPAPTPPAPPADGTLSGGAQ